MEYLLSIWSWIGDNVATIIALCALGFTWYQAAISRQHNKLSVKPHVTTFTANNDDDGETVKVRITLSNNGLGPAVIKKFEHSFDGRKIIFNSSKEAKDFITDFVSHVGACSMASTLAKEYVMSVGEEIPLVEVLLLKSPTVSNEIEALLDRTGITVTYESTYGDVFTYASLTEHE